MRFALVLVLASLASCGARSAPYHFRAPLLSGVSAPELQPPRPAADDRPTRASAGPAQHRARSSRLLARSILFEPGDSLVGQLRGLVGAREQDMTATAFAVSTLRAIGSALDDDLLGTRAGGDLVSLAQARGAWSDVPGATIGDLLVFDGVVDSQPASAIGVVIAEDERGVIEFIALQRGVVRRGFADPSRPRVKRDELGRVVNSHIRSGRSGDRRDSRYLAGELLAGRIAFERLRAR